MSELPKGWSTAKLEDLGDWSSGGTPSRKISANYGGSIPWVKTGDLNHQHIEEVEENITDAGLKNSSAKIFPRGTLLIAMYGATIGQTGVLKIDAATNQACAALLANGLTAEIIPYIWRYIISIQNYLKSIGQGGAQPNISQSILKQVPIDIAPLPEQRRILAKIDSLFGKSNRARSGIDHLPRLVEKYKQAILAAELTAEGKKQVVRFSDIAAFLNGDRGKQYPGDDEQLPKGHCLFLGTRNVRQGYFDFSETSFISEEKHRALRGGTMKRGDIVMTIRGTLGNCAVYDKNVPYDTVRINSAMIIVRPNVEANPAFLMWTIRSPIFLGWVSSSARGSAQPHLRGKDIEEKLIYFPDLKEQQAAVHRIETAFAWIDRLALEATNARKQIDHLDQVIFTKAFRGELVPQDPKDEPASVLLARVKAERTGAAAGNGAGKGLQKKRGRRAG